MSSLTMFWYIDRANGPRRRAFPEWSATAVWHEDVMAYTHGARHWPDRELIRVYVAAGNCVDFAGTMFCCLRGDAPVRRVEVFNGSKLDTVYLLDDTGEWNAHRPDRLPDALDEGEAYALPPTHEEQTPFAGRPLSFAARPGTLKSNEREVTKISAAAQLNAYIDRKVREWDIARVDEMQKLDAEIDVLLGDNL